MATLVDQSRIPLNIEQKTTAADTRAPRSVGLQRPQFYRLPDGAHVRQAVPPKYGRIEEINILELLPLLQDQLVHEDAEHLGNPRRALNSNRAVDPLENQISKPELGRIVPGLVDPTVRAIGVVDEYGRKMLEPSGAPQEMPSIPGVPGSGQEGLQKRLDAKRHGMGEHSGNILNQLKQMMGQGGQQQQQQQGAPQQPPTQVPLKQQGNLRQWRV